MDALPLIASNRTLLIAVEPRSGKLLWQQRLPTAPTRLFQVGRSLFVCESTKDGVSSRLHCIDVSTGAFIGRLELGFGITAGFVDGDVLYVAGGGGFACISTRGEIVWKAVYTVDAGLVSSKEAFVCTDSAGRELWRSDDPGARITGDAEGLILGALVAQPDLRDWRNRM